MATEITIGEREQTIYALTRILASVEVAMELNKPLTMEQLKSMQIQLRLAVLNLKEEPLLLTHKAA